MSGIYYALSILAIFIVIRWFIANDKVKPDEPTTGLLSLKTGKAASEPAGKSPERKKQRLSRRSPNAADPSPPDGEDRT